MPRAVGTFFCADFCSMTEGRDTSNLLGLNPIIASVLGSELAIEATSGFNYLTQYLRDIALVASGARLSELNLAERRREWLPYVLMPNGARTVGAEMLRDVESAPAGSVAVLRVSGFMQAETSGGSAPVRGMRTFAEDLYAAYDNPNIKGVIVEINSGGGELLAMEIASSAVDARNKPVVSHVYFAASAAYGLAASTDEVIALSEMTRVGSIGAVVSINRRALQQYAEEWIDLYGSASPNKNREFRSALNGDFSAMQQIVDEATARFQSKIKRYRTLKGDDDYIADTLSGDMFTANRARRRGLIDGVGGFNYVLNRVDAWTRIYAQKGV